MQREMSVDVQRRKRRDRSGIDHRLGCLTACALVLWLLAASAAADPYAESAGSWGQDYGDQWYLSAVGLETVPEDGEPVTVAVVDTGLDWHHLDFAWRNVWRNADEIPGNGIDDDDNGYVDDVIGWDFTAHTNKPWDYDGHGTLVAGIIAAQRSNGIGMAGINPHARVMVLKAMNDFGHGRATFIAEAVAYAVDNGADIINVSIAGPNTTGVERAAFEHARAHGVLVLVAAGNDAESLDDYGPASDPNVVTVGATNPAGERAAFSNWGPAVDIAAPGVDILSLRARRTDTLRDVGGMPYTPGSAYVGADKRYYRATGTSFAAPIVSGIASLVLSARPGLDAEALRRMLESSARDIDEPGIDNFSGYGLIDAGAALAADPDFAIAVRIDGVVVVQTGDGPAASVRGTADADALDEIRIEIGQGERPGEWRRVARHRDGVTGGEIARVPAAAFAGAPIWTLRVVVLHENGRSRESRFQLELN